MNSLYTLQGTVIEGKKRGRTLGYPTANIALSEIIPSGIYISYTTIAGKEHFSLTFIGEAKTFDESLYQSETHILDFNEDIYGKEIKITLVKKIRDNEKFTTVEALKEQMADDEKKARAFFKTDTFH